MEQKQIPITSPTTQAARKAKAAPKKKTAKRRAPAKKGVNYEDMAVEKAKANIYQLINKVRETVSYVQKDKKVQGYMAVTHDMVTAQLHDALVANGILVLQDLLSDNFSDTGKKTAAGAPIMLYEARYKITYQNVNDKEDNYTHVVRSHAEDTNDKAPGKAMSYAMKYSQLKTFHLEAGENEEGRIESKPQTLTPENYQALREVCEELGMDVDPTLESLAVNVYKVKKIEEINDQWAADAEKRLRQKSAKQKKENGDDSAGK